MKVTQGGFLKRCLNFGGLMVKAENNHHRETIIKYNLLQYIDYTNTITRNKEIIKEYASGKSYNQLS